MSGREPGIRAGGTSAGRTSMPKTWRRYCLTTLVIYGVLWLALAISPRDRADWALENALVVVFVPALVASLRWFPLSRLSWTLVLVFLSLHTVGAHYTYAEVPYDAWSLALFGRRLNDLLGLKRNHFDRLVHFSYGLLMAYPMRELFLRVADARGFWGYFLPLDLTLSTSATFELLEWAAVEVFGGDLGGAYLGMQGDVWDAQKDMALAGLGAAIAMALTLLVNRSWQRDFNREWAGSLRVKRRLPLGEIELSRMVSSPSG
jgi:putative membrane protein